MFSSDFAIFADRSSSVETTRCRLHAAGCSDRGRTRPVNEDCFAIDESLGLLLVADGMGGHAGGQVASRLATGTIVESLRQSAESAPVAWPFGFDASRSVDGNRLRTALQMAHIRVLEASLANRAVAGMGTTVVAAIERDGQLSVAWVGDSRLYLLDEAGLRRLTRDDSWYEAARLEHPDADLEVLQRHPLRNALTNVLGTTARTEVHIVEVPLAGWETMVLTTDGVHGTLDDAAIAHLLTRRTPPSHAASDLVAAAIGAGSTDNCTAVVGSCAAARQRL